MLSVPGSVRDLSILFLVAACLSACAVGPDAAEIGLDASLDAAPPPHDSGAHSDAADAPEPPNDAAIGGEVDAGGSTTTDAGKLDAGASDVGTDARETDAGAGAEPDAQQVADATLDADTGMPELDSGPQTDSGGTTDGSTGGDSGDSGGSEAGQTPVNCGPIVRTGVQLCDMGADYCGAMFTNFSGCTATCAAAGLTCATAYENVEGQCARDQARPAIACDSGHESDYCLCRRP
jgi:hypothetical protein